MTYDESHLRVLLHATTLLVILRLLAIKEPPLLSCWHDVTSMDLESIHEDGFLFFVGDCFGHWKVFGCWAEFCSAVSSLLTHPGQTQVLCGALAGDAAHGMIAQVMLTHDAFLLFQTLFRSQRVLRDAWDRWFAKARGVPPVVVATLERFWRHESAQQDCLASGSLCNLLGTISAAERSPARHTTKSVLYLIWNDFNRLFWEWLRRDWLWSRPPREMNLGLFGVLVFYVRRQVLKLICCSQALTRLTSTGCWYLAHVANCFSLLHFLLTATNGNGNSCFYSLSFLYFASWLAC